jgi:hypothetical protein
MGLAVPRLCTTFSFVNRGRKYPVRSASRTALNRWQAGRNVAVCRLFPSDMKQLATGSKPVRVSLCAGWGGGGGCHGWQLVIHTGCVKAVKKNACEELTIAMRVMCRTYYSCKLLRCYELSWLFCAFNPLILCWITDIIIREDADFTFCLFSDAFSVAEVIYNISKKTAAGKETKNEWKWFGGIYLRLERLRSVRMWSTVWTRHT